MKNLKIILGKKRKIKKFKNSAVEVVLYDKQQYKVAVRVLYGFSGLVDNLQSRQKQGLKATKIIRQQIGNNYRTIYQLTPIK